MRHFPSLLIALLASAPALAGQVRYVDVGATGANTGLSWPDAFVDLRAALAAAAPGDELWVADGTYLPGPTAAESDSFFLKSGVALYGGFAGGETSLAQRDWVANPAVLSGDVGQDDVLGNPWHSGWNINSANSAHVVTASGTDATAVLDGFVIRSGNTGPVGTPAGSSEMFGGGVYNLGGSPTIVHCTFEYNLAAFASGAALYNLDGSPTLRDCTFRHNWVHLGSGAGVFNVGSSQPVIEDCVFLDNYATTGAGGSEAQGAALASWMTPPLTVRRCRFEANSAQQFHASGAGIEQARGGGLSCFLGALFVDRCEFVDNRANAGGALFVWGDATITNSLFRGNRVYNMVVSGQTISGYASALGAQTSSASTVLVEGCTVVDNHVVGGESGAIWGGGSAGVDVRNSVLWGNTAPPPASIRQMSYKGNVDLAFDCVEGLFAPDPNDPPPAPGDVPGCIESDPLFAAPAGSDWRLSAGSPCVDTGSNAFVPGSAELDLDGNQRVFQGAASLTVDMGAYELGSQPPPTCPAIVVQPQPTTVVAGEPAVLQVLAAGQALAYRWRKGGVPLVDGGHVSGAATAVLRLDPTTRSDSGSYDVQVSNACSTVTSAPALLTVEPPPVATVFCSGDGSVVSCPCGNDKDPGEGCENSTGDGGALDATGSPSVGADDAVLTADKLPKNGVGLIFMGLTTLGGGHGVVFGDGLLCVQPTFRFPGASTGSSGELVLTQPVAKSQGNIQPGLSVHFQAWYRDPTGPCGSTFNTSNAITIQFVP